jgi:hypothetical protein
MNTWHDCDGFISQHLQHRPPHWVSSTHRTTPPLPLYTQQSALLFISNLGCGAGEPGNRRSDPELDRSEYQSTTALLVPTTQSDSQNEIRRNIVYSAINNMKYGDGP